MDAAKRRTANIVFVTTLSVSFVLIVLGIASYGAHEYLLNEHKKKSDNGDYDGNEGAKSREKDEKKIDGTYKMATTFTILGLFLVLGSTVGTGIVNLA